MCIRDSLSTYSQTAADVTGVEDSDPQQAATRLLTWLSSTDRRWLIVLDDVADPQAMAGLWPPETASGRTVVTSRRRDAALLGGRRLVEVGLFTAGEAAEYLRTRLGAEPHRLDEADKLAADLGYLPLALAQAVAYMIDLDLTCADYRQRLRKRRLDRLHPAALPDGQQQAVHDTWSLSISVADTETDGLAGIALQLAALLDPNGIPVTIFSTEAALKHYEQRLGHEVDGDDVHDTVRALYRLGLATITTDPDLRSDLVRAHALVQRVVREATLESQQALPAHAAADALRELWPDLEWDGKTARLGQVLRTNTSALIAATDDLLFQTHGVHRVIFRAGRSLGEIGLVTAARDHYEQLHIRCLRMLGPDHSNTLAARGHIAYWQSKTGDPTGAATAFEKLLKDDLRVLGPDHPDTLSARGNLAYTQGETGNPTGAAIAFEQLLTDRLRVLGPDHPATLTTRGNLARWHGEAGNPAEAAIAFEQLLTDFLRVLGPDHPDTLITRGNLAYWRGEAGDPAGATTAFEQLFTDLVRVLGPDHPHTLAIRINLAYWRVETGDPVAAITIFEQLLTDLLRVLGPDHPHTQTARSNFVNWRKGNQIRPSRTAKARQPAEVSADFDPPGRLPRSGD